MPYIEDEFRQGARVLPVGAGELDYQITMNVIDFMQKSGWNFTNMNTVVGVLENVKDEFQRRIMHPYENLKCAKNGDVYPNPLPFA